MTADYVAQRIRRLARQDAGRITVVLFGRDLGILANDAMKVVVTSRMTDAGRVFRVFTERRGDGGYFVDVHNGKLMNVWGGKPMADCPWCGRLGLVLREVKCVSEVKAKAKGKAKGGRAR